MSAEKKLILKDEVDPIVGCAIEVLPEPGHGYHERPCEDASVVEFGFPGIPFQQQPGFALSCKGSGVGEFVPDLIAHEPVVVDAKVIDQITGSRARPDLELSSDHRMPRRPAVGFQTRQTGMGTPRSMIRVSG